MVNTPYVDSETKEMTGGVIRYYIFARGVKGLVRLSSDSTRVVVFLSFTDRIDSLLWEPKRVLPLLDKFDPRAEPSIDSWALTFPATLEQDALRELDAVIESRRFYV